jgi:hypothetical protein
MQIYGLDFTSAPRRTKPITCAVCDLEGQTLRLHALEQIETFAAFEAFLEQQGPWIAGFDFPFGQPRKLIDNLGWPVAWERYVAQVANMSLDEFVNMLAEYRSVRPTGDKQHLRQADVLAHSCSPMMLYGVPVGRMFYQGAPRLLRSSLNILPCRPTSDLRIGVEAYPRLVANRWIGTQQGYKHDDRRKQIPAQWVARQAIIVGLQTDLAHYYGFEIVLSEVHSNAMLNDGSGDTLDGVLCAIQAAWAYLQREQGYGIPQGCDSSEGWIVDPVLLAVIGHQSIRCG